MSIIPPIRIQDLGEDFVGNRCVLNNTNCTKNRDECVGKCYIDNNYLPISLQCDLGWSIMSPLTRP